MFKCVIIYIMIMDPRQALAFKSYTSPGSSTFGNMRQSLLLAGFSKGYSKNMTSNKPAWLTENISNTVNVIKKAERNVKVSVDRGISEPENKLDMEMNKLTMNSSQFVLKTLARDKYTDEKQQAEVNIQVNINNYGENEAQNAPVRDLNIEEV